MRVEEPPGVAGEEGDETGLAVEGAEAVGFGEAEVVGGVVFPVVHGA